MTNLADIIQDLKSSKGLSEELIEIVIKDFLKAAYKKRYGIDDNAEVIIDIINNEVALYSKKTIVEKVLDKVLEIDFIAAKEYEHECEIGDQLLLEINPDTFTRTEVMIANQKATQRIREFESNSLFSEFKSKEGEIVIGYFLREHNNNIIVDLGKTEGILPKKFQSPRDVFHAGDRIKALINEVKKQGNRFEVVLSRTHTDFIKKIFELEVPELYDGTVEIVKIVREPGYRSKIAVISFHSEVDPVGTCVGTKGIRINNVMLELDGERIDILRYNQDPLIFIHNALSPAEVKQVIVEDYAKKSAIAVVDDEKFSIAIGKLGLNVRLANRLTDWSINIKTVSQFQEMDEIDEFAQVFENTVSSDEDEEINITKVNELPSLDKSIIDKLLLTNIIYIEDLLQISNETLTSKGLNEDEIKILRQVLQEFIDIGYQDKPCSENATDEDEDENMDMLLIESIPFHEVVLKKLKESNILKLYDLIELSTEKRLQEITSLTTEDILHIESVIKEYIEIE